jgi:hypothetical protein
MTTDARHSKASPTNIGVHVVQAWSYADSTARLAATGFVAADVGKMAEQQSDETWWLLTNHSPITWKDITGSGGGTDEDAIHDNVAGEIAAVTEKVAPVGDDIIIGEDSAAANAKVKIKLSNLPAIQDAESLLVQVRKDSSGTINAGQTVYLVGWDVGGGVPTVELTDASSAATMPVFGVARTTITNLATGTVVVSGELTGQDTSSYSVGDALYASETAGELTSTKPTGTALIQRVGQVTRSHPSLGVIQIFGAGRSNDVPNIPQDQLWLGNGSGVATPTDRSGIDDTAIHDNVANEITAITEKTTLADDDEFVLEDGEASYVKKSAKLSAVRKDFGKDYDSASSLAESSTTSTDWQTKAQLVSAVLTGTYRVGFSCRYWHSGVADTVQVRLQNTTDATTLCGEYGVEPKDLTDRLPGSGFAEVTFTGASKTFEIQYRQQRGGTAYIDQARIEMWKVS